MEWGDRVDLLFVVGIEVGSACVCACVLLESNIGLVKDQKGFS